MSGCVGVARTELLDERGVFSGPRLLAAYYGRYRQLAVRIGTLLSVLTSRPPDTVNALGPAEALVRAVARSSPWDSYSHPRPVPNED